MSAETTQIEEMDNEQLAWSMDLFQPSTTLEELNRLQRVRYVLQEAEDNDFDPFKCLSDEQDIALAKSMLAETPLDYLKKYRQRYPEYFAALKENRLEEALTFLEGRIGSSSLEPLMKAYPGTLPEAFLQKVKDFNDAMDGEMQKELE